VITFSDSGKAVEITVTVATMMIEIPWQSVKSEYNEVSSDGEAPLVPVFSDAVLSFEALVPYFYSYRMDKASLSALECLERDRERELLFITRDQPSRYYPLIVLKSNIPAIYRVIQEESALLWEMIV
jgi:hypothetical protein